MLKVSVVTISYNSMEQISQTLEALKKQNYPCIESVIIDGGSTDGTVEVIEKFVEEFQGEVQWVSEKDRGIYHAINKGIRMTTGDLIGFCWDLYTDEHTISKIVKKVEDEHTDGVHSNLIYIGEDGKIIRCWKMGQGTIQKGWMPAYPTLYLRRRIFETYGMFDESYKCSGDFEFMVRILKDHTVRLSYIPEVLIHMFYGGVSTRGPQAYMQSIMESYIALRRHKIHFPAFVILMRMIRTTVQFKKSRSKANLGKDRI